MSTKFNNGDVVTFRHEHLKNVMYGVVYSDKFGQGVYFGNIDTYSYGECTIEYALRGGLEPITSHTLTGKVRKTLDWLLERNTRLADWVKANTPTDEEFDNCEECEEVVFNDIPAEEVVWDGTLPTPDDEPDDDGNDNNGSFDEFFDNMFKELRDGKNSKSA